MEVSGHKLNPNKLWTRCPFPRSPTRTTRAPWPADRALSADIRAASSGVEAIVVASASGDNAYCGPGVCFRVITHTVRLATTLVITAAVCVTGHVLLVTCFLAVMAQTPTPPGVQRASGCQRAGARQRYRRAGGDCGTEDGERGAKKSHSRDTTAPTAFSTSTLGHSHMPRSTSSSSRSRRRRRKQGQQDTPSDCLTGTK